eukprot:70189-Prymnesium_polylepis.1
MKYARDHGCAWGDDFLGDLCCLAASGGHLDMLKYLIDNGRTMNSRGAFESAASGGVDVLQYVLHHGLCTYDEDQLKNACANAARTGKASVLQFLHEKLNAPLFVNASDAAASEGQMECMKYLIDHGCEWDSETIDYAEKNGHSHMAHYLTSQLRDLSMQPSLMAGVDGGGRDTKRSRWVGGGVGWRPRGLAAALVEGGADAMLAYRSRQMSCTLALPSPSACSVGQIDLPGAGSGGGPGAVARSICLGPDRGVWVDLPGGSAPISDVLERLRLLTATTLIYETRCSHR